MIQGPRILLFTGEGKGKTTAALGMVLRAVGHGMAVAVIQFIKNDSTTGEIAGLNRLDVEVFQGGKGFVSPAESPRFVPHRQAAQATLDRASDVIASGHYDMVVLDEICSAVERDLLDEPEVLTVLQEAPADCVLVLTGRGATEGLRTLADTVSEINCCKHAYTAGLAAQKGVEF